MQPATIPAGNPPRSARPAAVSRYLLLALVAYYTGCGAAGCADLFYRSAHPAQVTTLLPFRPPDWVLALAVQAAASWWVLPLPLLIIGLSHVLRAARAGWRWPAAWAGAAAAAVVLEALLITGTNIDWLLRDPAYPPPPGLSWISLAEAAAFLLLGAMMTGVVIGVRRPARRQPA